MTRSLRSILDRLRTLKKRVSALRALHPDHDPVTMAALGQMSDEQLHLLERVASDRQQESFASSLAVKSRPSRPVKPLSKRVARRYSYRTSSAGDLEIKCAEGMTFHIRPLRTEIRQPGAV